MGDIRLGTSGYSFQDWKGEVYPGGIRDSEMFAYYVNQFRFKTVEINYTYYRQPSAKSTESLAKKSPKDFDFTVKLYGGITHEPWKSSPAKVDPRLCGEFLDGIKPLTDSGKLGCLLAQFPSSMRKGPEAWDYLHSLPDALGNLPLVYEFRNKEWAGEETLQTLKQAGIGFCAVDEPQIGPLMPLVPAVTSDIAYLRLHGRNPEWFTNPDHRYDYLYSESELGEMLPTIEEMASSSRTLYVEFNNCHAGSAVKNAKMLLAFLDMDLPPMQAGLDF